MVILNVLVYQIPLLIIFERIFGYLDVINASQLDLKYNFEK